MLFYDVTAAFKVMLDTPMEEVYNQCSIMSLDHFALLKYYSTSAIDNVNEAQTYLL